MTDSTNPAEKVNWAILEAKKDDQKAIYRLRTDRPENAADLGILVTIAWQYPDQSVGGFPNEELMKSMESFEETIESLVVGTDSKLMLVSTGMGLKEWAFYATSFESFIEKFNTLMSGAPRVPVELTYSEDSEWEYWQKYREQAV